MREIQYNRPHIINQEVTGEYPKGEELAILRKAIYQLANGNEVDQEFYDYFSTVEAIKDSLPIV